MTEGHQVPNTRRGLRRRSILAVTASAVLLATLSAVPTASAVAPSPELGCVPTLATFTNSTSRAITDNSTITSTITVAGAGAHLADLDVTTFILHTSPYDLDIFLTSPSGTEITLTTDNGVEFDNAFNGTVWDDDADPGSPIPYGNGGLQPAFGANPLIVTDHRYTDGVPEPTLTPEEPLAALIGENPNGIWTLTVTDDANVDSGTLTSWSLGLTTYPLAPPPAATSPSFAANLPQPVAIGDNQTVSSTVTVSGLGSYLTDVDARTFIRHTAPGDLDITITSPAGTIQTLTTDNGGIENDVFNGTVWNDSTGSPVNGYFFVNGLTTGPLAPEEPFGAFIGENPNGVWTLTVHDDANIDQGALDAWSLGFRTTSGPCLPDLAITKTAPASATPGQNVAYAISAKNQGSTNRAGVSWTDTLPAGTTFVSLVQNTGPAFTCTTPAVGASGAINCNIATLPATTSGTFTLTTKPSSTAASVSNTASIGPSAGDPIPGNNTATAATTIACTPAQTISTPRTGSVVLSGGAWCVSNTTLSGPLLVTAGTTVILRNATLGGPVTASTPAGFAACGSTFKQGLSVTGSTGYVLVGDPGDDACAGNTITGAVALTNNKAGVEISGSQLGSSLSLVGNLGGGPFAQDAQPSVERNAIKGTLDCSGNTPAPSNHGMPNTVTGKRTGQCAAL